jgi:phage terminase Nu1 subunit (DNA packaging protein)
LIQPPDAAGLDLDGKDGLPPFPGEVVTTKFADLVGVHYNTVVDYIRKGLPSRRVGQRTLIGVAAGFQWLIAKKNEDIRLAREQSDPDVARTAKVTAEAKLKELDLAERQGSLVSVERVAEEWAQSGSAIREAVLAIAAVAVQAGLIPAAKEAELDAMCRTALKQAVGNISEPKA